jgi:hypothetical protein
LTRRLLAAAPIALSLVLFASRAGAQLHWDASAQVGVMKRNLVDRPTGSRARDATFGPAGELAGHVALMPLVRLGAYFGHDISPFQGDVSARDITWGGLRAKIMSPWPRGDVRAWLFVGFGYAGVYQRSTSSAERVVHGAGGGFFEVPFGLGASYKLRKPWELCAELGGRTGFGHTGSVYDAPGPRVTTAAGAAAADTNALPAGVDRFAIGLTIGILADL